MRAILFVFIVFLIASCAAAVDIKDKNMNSDINDASIKTTKIEINGDVEETKKVEKPKPSFIILSPKDGQSINSSDVVVELEASNFTNGYFRVWLDSADELTNEKTVIFSNVSSGKHSVTVELVDSNYAPLNPKATKTIIIDAKPLVINLEPATQGNLREFAIEADDYGFYPDLVHAKIGDTVMINFKFRDHLIYYAGLDIIGPFPDIKYRLKDEQPITRNFTMRETTIIKSFWPSSGVKKAEMGVEVEK